MDFSIAIWQTGVYNTRMFTFIKNLFIKYKEIIMYLIFGVLTTAVNWVVYSLLVKLCGVNITVSNIIAWFASVIFAFVTNKIWVFESKSWEIKLAFKEFCSFVASRLATGVIEWVGLPLLVKLGVDQTIFGIEGFVAKVIVSVIVVILNYVFSKLITFRTKKEQ